MPPDTPKLISIQTLNQVIFNSGTKPSQFRSLHWHQVNSDLPYWNQVYFDHPQNNQVNFDVNTKTMSFSARVIMRVIPTGTCSCDTAAINVYHINTSTNSYYSWRVHHYTTKPRKYCRSIETIVPYFMFYSMVYTWLRMILVAGLRCVPFLLYVVFLGAIYRSYL